MKSKKILIYISFIIFSLTNINNSYSIEPDSRFVSSTIQHSNPNFLKKLRLRFPFCFTPSPKRNVSICNRNYYYTDTNSCIKINRNIFSGYFKSIEKK